MMSWTQFLQEMIRAVLPVLMGALLHKLGVNGFNFRAPDPKAPTLDPPGGGG